MGFYPSRNLSRRIILSLDVCPGFVDVLQPRWSRSKNSRQAAGHTEILDVRFTAWYVYYHCSTSVKLWHTWEKLIQINYVLYGYKLYPGAIRLTARAMHTERTCVTLGNRLGNTQRATQEGIHHVSLNTLTSASSA